MTTVPFSRPYFRESTVSLRRIFEQKSANPLVLVQLTCELMQRRKRPAKELLADTQQRLVEMLSQSFVWPSTEASTGSGELDETSFRYQKGLFSQFGYHVGRKGRRAKERHRLLDLIYESELDPTDSSGYIGEWGAPLSIQRLRKMAESIAAFARNAKRRSPQRFKEAISDWEVDLAYLKATYYIGRYVFPWPDTRT